MKYSNRFSLLNLALMAIGFTTMGMAEDTGAGSTEPAAGEAPAAKPARETLEIIRGRMPVAIVNLVRHGNLKGETVAVKAKRFGTTVGKVDDIVKGRNFGYVTADFAPTQAQKDEGIAWLKTHPRYDADNVDDLVNELDKTPVATEEQAKAFEEARAANRGQTTTTKTGEKADAGGGNRRGKAKEPAVESGAAAEATAASLTE